MWNQPEYNNAVNKICTDYVASNGNLTINDLATKVAEDAQLSPEGIRTVVRLANVVVFENRFAKNAEDKTDDRMIEFEVGDPEIVINRVYANAKVAYDQTIKTASYAQELDLQADFISDMEKTAEDTGHYISAPNISKKNKPTKPAVRHLYKQAVASLHLNTLQAKAKWERLTKEAAAVLKAQDSRVAARTLLEKNALLMLGEDIIPELIQIQDLTTGAKTSTNLFDGVKIATVLHTHVAVNLKAHAPVLERIKEAQAARREYIKNRNSLIWLKNNESVKTSV